MTPQPGAEPELGTSIVVSSDDGMRLRRECRVRDLVSRHRDVAPGAAATTVRRTVRGPERLLRTAIRAAQSEQLGLAPVAALLEREETTTPCGETSWRPRPAH